MLVTEMFNRLLIRSGQFILKVKNVELDIDSFRVLVEDALNLYSEACPFEYKYQITLVNRRQFIWTEEFDNFGFFPDWISEVTPVRNASVPYFSSLNTGQYDSRTNKNLEIIEPLEAPWDWNSQTKALTVPYSATYDVLAIYNHRLTSYVDNENKTIYEVKTISPRDTVFFMLLQAMFIQALGRSRRAFTMNDLPILMDAETMASEGESMMEKAEENLNKVRKTYLAYG